MNSAIKPTIPLAAALLVAVLLAFMLPSPAPAQQADTFSTGVSKDDRTVHREYSLKVVFAAKQGAFRAGVNVTIYDQSGAKVVDTFSQGPWLFVDLPEGSYRVVARQEGEAKGLGAAGEVKITAGRQKALYLIW